MPIFEYRCSACGERFERLVRAAGESATCPACDSPRVVRLLSAPSAVRNASTSAVRDDGGGCCGGGGCGCQN